MSTLPRIEMSQHLQSTYVKLEENRGVRFVSEENIENRDFLGSCDSLYLISQHSIVIQAPGCIAAPLVTMVAKNAIRFGTENSNNLLPPVKFYVSDQLGITTRTLTIGDIQLIEEPADAFISCRRLKFLQYAEEEPWHVEVVKSWVISNDTEIQTAEMSRASESLSFIP